MSAPVSREATICLAVDRFVAIVKPPRGEPSPVLDGATAAEWATHAGLGCDPSAILAPLVVGKISIGSKDAETVAAIALQRLSLRGQVESIGGSPRRYRPIRKR